MSDPKKSFDECMERILKACGIRTQVELAAILDIRQSSISDAKRRARIPDSWCIRLLDTFGLNPDWVRYGTGDQVLLKKDLVPVKVEGQTGRPVTISVPVVDQMNAPAGTSMLPSEWVTKNMACFTMGAFGITEYDRASVGALVAFERQTCPNHLQLNRLSVFRIKGVGLFLDMPKLYPTEPTLAELSNGLFHPVSWTTMTSYKDVVFVGRVHWIKHDF